MSQIKGGVKISYEYIKRYRQTDRGKEVRAKSNKKYYGKTKNAKNNRSSYTLEELELIEKHELSDHELAELLGRSVMAIQTKRSRLKNSA